MGTAKPRARRRRVWVAAMAGSLVLHLAAWWGLARPPARHLAPVPARAVPIELVLTEPPAPSVEQTRPPPPPVERETARERPPTRDRRVPPSQLPASELVGSPRAGARDDTAAVLNSSASEEMKPQREAAQSPLSLPPSPPSDQMPAYLLPSERGLSLPYGADGPHGHTLHNRPEELPSPEAMAAAEAARVRGRVEGFAGDQLASLRAQSLVPGYFTDLRRELNAWAAHPPELLQSKDGTTRFNQWGQQLWHGSVAPGLARFGRGQPPYAAPDGWREDVSPLVEDMAKNGDMLAKELRKTAIAGNRMREFADGRMGTELRVVVELKQAPDGALVSTTLLEASGVKPFDEWVLSTAGNAIEGVKTPVPDGGVGVHPDGLHTVWLFKGVVSYKRQMKNAKLLDDGWYLAVSLLTSTIAGNFDEMTGDVTYVDLRYPHYECTVSLLKLY